VPARQRSFRLARNKPFSRDELDLAWRIWGVLTGLDRQIQALASRSPDPAVAGELGLSHREVAVLGLAADGLTAAAIGRRLAIRERTVRKHLEHAYAKLKVTNRVSAVLRARQAGVLSFAPSPPA
jgi:ATP/maltotriose-dependent transcriptional regulator MalT